MQGLGSGITLGIADRLPQMHGVGKYANYNQRLNEMVLNEILASSIEYKIQKSCYFKLLFTLQTTFN